MLHSRSRPQPTGGALGRTRRQQQERSATGGAAAAAASSPQGVDDIFGISAGGAPQDSTHGSEAAASASANASAVAAARLLCGALEAALLRGACLEAMEGRIVEAVEGRIMNAQRVEGIVGQRVEGSIVERVEAMEGRMAGMETRIVEAVERRIVKRMEVRWGSREGEGEQRYGLRCLGARPEVRREHRRQGAPLFRAVVHAC